MRKMKAESHVLGLAPGDTFESDDEFYDSFIEGGHLSVVEDEAPETPSEPSEGTAPAPARAKGRRAAETAPAKPDEPETPAAEGDGAEA